MDLSHIYSYMIFCTTSRGLWPHYEHYCESGVLSAKYYTKSIISMAIVERERPLEGGFQTLLMKPEEIHTTVSFDEFLFAFIKFIYSEKATKFCGLLRIYELY